MSDITVGDFHGLDAIDPAFSSFGASLVLAHSEKGKMYASELGSFGKYKEYSVEQCLQPRLKCPPSGSPLRKLILKDFISLSPSLFKLKYAKLFVAQ